jgi:hypothetical protein
MKNTYVEIELLWHEYAMASEIGRLRQLAAIRRGSPDKHGFEGLGWSEHIEGACGELVVARYLGIYWNGSVDTFKSPDLGANIQVRTRASHTYELIVRPNDADDDIFVLVTGKCPVYRLRGFLRGSEAKMGEYSQKHGGRPEAFFVPHARLRPPEELERALSSAVEQLVYTE